MRLLEEGNHRKSRGCLNYVAGELPFRVTGELTRIVDADF